MGAKDKKWFKDKAKLGCQLCGHKSPGLKNNGLQAAHILSKKLEKGNDEEVNCLVLCKNCELAFDRVIKPALFDAMVHFKIRKLPESWENAEGRGR